MNRKRKSAKAVPIIGGITYYIRTGPQRSTTDLPDRQGVIDYLSMDFLKWVQEMVLPPVGEDHGEQG